VEDTRRRFAVSPTPGSRTTGSFIDRRTSRIPNPSKSRTTPSSPDDNDPGLIQYLTVWFRQPLVGEARILAYAKPGSDGFVGR